MAELVKIDTATCFHCGELCKDEEIYLQEKAFCCEGCKVVYEILQENGLCTYYDLEKNPGISLKGKNFGDKYAYLINQEIQKSLLDFSSENLNKIILYIPAIHCSSCIWLLENLYNLQKGIFSSRVNFVKKEIALSFDPTQISLQKLVELLATLGYEPYISLENIGEKAVKKNNRDIFLKIGITGFCTGNIMALSFPEYFGLEDVMDGSLKLFITWLNVILALPIFFYGASGYFISACKSLKEKVINLDVPISIGIFTLYARSMYEILAGIGPGYLDSLAGLVFFLLIGKWLQHKTYESLSFDRNYKSYFPLASNVIKDGKQEIIPVTQLMIGDVIQIRNLELIPADSQLLSDSAFIDYSFVTGESDPVEKQKGDYIYAGGRQIGNSIELKIKKPVSQSYLTQLWNNETFAKEKITPVTKLAALFSKYFTYITLAVALLAAIYWYFHSTPTMWNAFTAVLIVACPCALSLAMPFTMENTTRIFGRNGFYVKNPGVIQHLATISHIVFDKTGTLTQSRSTPVIFKGEPLTAPEQAGIRSLAKNSTHPLSRKIYKHLSSAGTFEVQNFKEISGSGIEGVVEGQVIRLGSTAFIKGAGENKNTTNASVHVEINGRYVGYFLFENSYREEVPTVLEKLRDKFKLSLLSGDHQVDIPVLSGFFGEKENLHFEKKPFEKLNFIKNHQNSGEKLMMVGDGLNDAGALKQSDVGMVLTEDVQSFFPACDVLADARNFQKIPDIIRFSSTSVNIVKVSFLLSMVYNFIAVSWAVSGNLSPVFAAIFMPLSSMSVVAFAVGMSSLYARWRKL